MRPTAPEGPTAGSLGRGVALIVVAVVLGIVLLQATDSTPFEELTADDGTTTTSAPAGDDAPTTTSAPAPAREPGMVTVLVANASGVAGAAGRATDDVTAAGFKAAEPANAEQAETSVVYFAPGFEAEAGEVAAVFDPPPEVQPIPDPAPLPDLRGANVVVIIAPDLAGG